MSDHRLQSSPDRAALERAATEWFFRRDAGLSLAEEAEFAAWVEADDRNPAMLAEIESTWDQSASVREKVLAPVVDHPVKAAARQPTRLKWVPAVMAAAAAVALAYIGWWRPAHYSNEVDTHIGDYRILALPDGSQVRMNTDTELQVAYSPAERRIRLGKGEAYFTAAKNTDRPFIVEASGVAVQAVGTAFNVRLRQASVDVLVVEGKVKVGTPGDVRNPLVTAVEQSSAPPAATVAAVLVNAGQKVSVPLVMAMQPSITPEAIETVEQPLIEQTLAWQRQQVEFADATLAEMAAEFNRYNRHQLVIAESELAQRRFGGTFPANDYRSFVRVLESTFGISARDVGDSTVLSAAR